MRFLVTRYLKDEDFPDSSTDITAVGLDALTDFLGMPAEHLADVYPLKQEDAERFRHLTGITLDLEKYEYFLEAE
ncbi:hypothetical protein [Streptomyces sp. NRRL B-24085]|uniref:DUF7683 domain-containing protein n=1 Tax=Streptomyces sp. NRRL B-24085 TaxID=1709476 RepID=UPI0006B36BF1|nr:hypothetical protein [Streptomyces sp. NRRL B-24085]